MKCLQQGKETNLLLSSSAFMILESGLVQARHSADVVREGAAKEPADERGRVVGAWGAAVAGLGTLCRTQVTFLLHCPHT